MKYVEKYLETVVKIKPLGELTTKEDILNDMSGEMIYIDGKCSDIFISHADYTNWLEKQGEQRLADKVKPKFKVGDWVVNKGHSYLIADIDFLDNRYLFEIGGYTHEQLNWEYIENVDNKYHLWTIADAKDGDILMSRAPFIYGKQCPYGGINWYNGKFIKASNYVFKDSPVHPATKEQRDLLFTKMREAGYEWDSEKKELREIEQEPDWSEEDEKMINKLMAVVELYYVIDDDLDKQSCLSWLKSLKTRYTWKPSDEQIKVCKEVYADLLSAKGFDVGTINSELNRLEEQLKKLKE